MSDPRDHKDYIPADNVLLRGYCGPVEMLGLHPRRPDEWVTTAYGNGGMANGADPKRLRLNPALAPVRDHIARVMAGGMRCPACRGVGKHGALPAPDSPRDLPCYACNGSGYLLPPAPIEHLLDRPGSRLTAAQSAALVAWSYRSWARGGPVLRGVAVFIESEPQGAHSWRERGDLCAHDSIGNPRTFGVWPVRNTQECYDAVLHEKYYATVNDDGSVTTPDLPPEPK